jgi:hypothetical protein
MTIVLCEHKMRYSSTSLFVWKGFLGSPHCRTNKEIPLGAQTVAFLHKSTAERPGEKAVTTKAVNASLPVHTNHNNNNAACKQPKIIGIVVDRDLHALEYRYFDMAQASRV